MAFSPLPDDPVSPDSLDEPWPAPLTALGERVSPRASPRRSHPSLRRGHSPARSHSPACGRPEPLMDLDPDGGQLESTMETTGVGADRSFDDLPLGPPARLSHRSRSAPATSHYGATQLQPIEDDKGDTIHYGDGITSPISEEYSVEMGDLGSGRLGGVSALDMPPGLVSGLRSTSYGVPLEPIMEVISREGSFASPSITNSHGSGTFLPTHEPFCEGSHLLSPGGSGTPVTSQSGSAAEKERRLSRHEQAAWHVEDGIFGLTVLDYSNSRQSSRETYLLHERIRTKIFAPAVLFALASSFLEVPLWCGNGHWVEWTDPHELCVAPDRSHIWLGPWHYVPKLYSVVLEFVALAAIFVCVGLAQLESNNHTDKAESRPEDYQIDRTRLVIASLWAMDFSAFVVFNQCLDFNMPWRFALVLKVSMFFTLDTMMNIIVSFRSLGLEVLKVLGMYFSVIGLFGWVGAVALVKNSGQNSMGTDVNTGFTSVTEAMGTMFYAAELMNLPDAVLPMYVRARSSFAFFVAFLVLSQFFFFLCLAVVYKSYSDDQVTLTREFFANRARNLGRAFKILAEVNPTSGYLVVRKEDFLHLVEHTNEHPLVTTMGDQELRYCWNSVDGMGSGYVAANEFYELMDVMQFQFKKVPVGGYFTSLPEWAKFGFTMTDLEAMIDSGVLDRTVNYVLCLNLGLLVVYSLRDLGVETFGFLDQRGWIEVEFAFSLLFLLELGLRLAVDSWEEYLSVGAHKFDVAAILAPLVAQSLWLLRGWVAFGHTELVYLSALRILRLLRVVAETDTLSFIAGCAWRVLSGSQGAAGLLVGALYLFAPFAQFLFGGKIYMGNPVLTDTVYRASNYDTLNFNDLYSCMTTLTLSIVSGVNPQIYEATTAVSTWLQSTVFWLAYFVTVVVFSFNIVTSFVIDLFLRLYEEDDVEDKEESELDAPSLLFKKQTSSVLVVDTSGLDDVYKKLFMNDEKEYSQIVSIFIIEARMAPGSKWRKPRTAKGWST